MKDKNKISSKPDRSKDLTGYPLYPESEDIFNQFQEEKEIDPEDISKKKVSPDKKKPNRAIDLSEDESGSDLDVPGSELDDNEENIGNEDEENNYYSLGGDDHNDLEEEKEE